MMAWKKIIRNLLTVLLLVLMGVEIYMEAHFGCHELSVTSTDTEAILRRVPETVITEKDKALLTELMDLPSVQGLLEAGESGDIHASEDPEAAAAAEKYLSGEEAGSMSVGPIFFEDGFVMITRWEEKKSLFYLQLTPEENGAAYYKLYVPKRGTSYENWDNERARKSEVHRRWFAWLQDGVWKEGE